MRRFNELLEEITIDDSDISSFTPIMKIVCLATNFNDNAIKNNSKSWINDYYDCCLWYQFDISDYTHYIKIDSNYNISKYMRLKDGEFIQDYSAVSNQVLIFELLKKLEFI